MLPCSPGKGKLSPGAINPVLDEGWQCPDPQQEADPNGLNLSHVKWTFPKLPFSRMTHLCMPDLRWIINSLFKIVFSTCYSKPKHHKVQQEFARIGDSLKEHRAWWKDFSFYKHYGDPTFWNSADETEDDSSCLIILFFLSKLAHEQQTATENYKRFSKVPRNNPDWSHTRHLVSNKGVKNSCKVETAGKNCFLLFSGFHVAMSSFIQW